MLTSLVRLAFLILIIASPVAAQDASTYVVRPGDTLYRISQMYEISVDELRRLNALENSIIKVGQVLIVTRPEGGSNTVRALDPLPEGGDQDAPIEARTAPAWSAESAESASPVSDSVTSTAGGSVATYEVRPGDTLFGIAARFGTAAYLLYTMNDGIRGPLEPGTQLKVPAEAPGEAAYIVRRGDTLFGVARQFGVSVDELRRANRLTDDALHIDQALRIPGASNRATVVPGQERHPGAYATGLVAVYPGTFAGRLTASGRPYDPAGFTVSHRSLPLGTVLLIENPTNGQSTFAEVSDRGPLDDRHLMDVSAAVAGHLRLDTTRARPVLIRIIE